MRRRPSTCNSSVSGLALLFEREKTALKRIARSLQMDDASAEDIVQDAWLASLRQPREEVRAPREWFRSVVRNLTLQEHRRRERRRYREQLAAHSEVVEDSAIWVDRYALIGSVLSAIARLDEPLRSVIRMHYLEGDSIGRIAERIGRPYSTVKKQLARGRQTLKNEHIRQLDQDRELEKLDRRVD